MAAAGMCATGGACGGGETTVTGERWEVVGKGKGSYERVTSLKYVGEGHGSIEKESSVLISGRSPVVGIIICMLCIPVLIGLGYLLIWTGLPRGASDVVVHPAATQPDCVTGFDDWENSWTKERRDFCCSHFRRACKAEVREVPKWVVHDVNVPVDVPVNKEVPVPVTSVKTVQVKAPDPYQCDDKDAVDSWSADHQRWCCYAASLGCKPIIVRKTVYNTVTQIKEVPVPHYIEPKESKVHIIHKNVSYKVRGTPKIIPVKLPREVIYKDRVQLVPKLLEVPEPGKVIVVRKPVPHQVQGKPIYVTVPVVDKASYDCDEGYKNWYFGWSDLKKKYCCSTETKGCPGSWHGSLHLHTQVHVSEGMGKATGRIYDCHAGFSNWMQGWSVSKKKWCCDREQRGCEKFYCDGAVHMWSGEKRDWCCSHFQQGCRATTLSPLGCHASCVLKGHSSSCHERIHWTQHNVFSGRGNACALAYSQVQVECDVCRACSIEAAGCSVGHVETSEAFDCHAAYNNFFRAWSPAKKQWCCSMKKMGCEGDSPPSVDPGVGMVWKHVQVNGYWVWQAVHGAGGSAVVSLPYDCQAGLAHRLTGWSPGKKAWCCHNKQIGCMDVSAGAHSSVAAAGGATGGAAAGAGGAAAGAAAGGLHPPGVAGHGMMWKHIMSGGHWHWEQHHIVGHVDMGHLEECNSHWPNGWQQAWSPAQKDYCCTTFGRGC